MDSLAITDHGALYGIIDFYRNALDEGIRPIIGCEVYVAPRSHRDRTPADRSPYHLTLLAKDNTGYKNLLQLVTRAHLDDFVACYNPESRRERRENERFRRFDYDDLLKRDKVNLDIFWLQDESMEDSANLPPPDRIADEIVEDLRAALEQMEEIAADLSPAEPA